MSISIVAISLLSIIALAVPGFLLTKKKMITSDSLPAFSNFLLFVTSPVLTFVTFQDIEYDPSLITDLAHAALLSFVIFGLFSFLAIVIGKPKKASLETRVSSFASVMPNCTFMGIPLLQALFPGNPYPIIYCAVISAFFNFFVWSTGSYMLSGNKKYASLKKALLNPNMLALYISLAFYFANIRVADYIYQLDNVITLLGNSTTPLAMLILGIRLADISFKDIFGDKRVYFVSVLKLVAMPLITFVVLLLFKPFMNPMIITVMYIISAMPAATTTVVFAERILKDGKFAAACFVNSTVLSVITIPLLLLIA